MLDYGVLRLLWWVILGGLLIGVAVADGLDLGALMLLPIIGRTDIDRRVVLNTIGPVWEGNQVWLILGGGAIFAAFPPLYALAFSGFYLAMLLLLAMLILRPVGILYRSRIDDSRWRTVWDASLCMGGLVISLVFGVAFGNVLQGAPFRFDDDLRVIYAGNLFDLFNPFAVLCGVVSVAMIAMHGAAYVAAKTEDRVRARARTACLIAAASTGALFVIAGFWAAHLNGYVLASPPDPSGPSNPLLKTVIRHPGALMDNYRTMSWMLAAPLLGGFGALTTTTLAALPRPRPGLTFLTSGLTVAGVVATAGVSLFPFLLPSSLDPNASLTIWDASASRAALMFMTVATAILLPIVLAYTAWVYRVMRGPVTRQSVEADHHAY